MIIVTTISVASELFVPKIATRARNGSFHQAEVCSVVISDEIEIVAKMLYRVLVFGFSWEHNPELPSWVVRVQVAELG